VKKDHYFLVSLCNLTPLKEMKFSKQLNN